MPLVFDPTTGNYVIIDNAEPEPDDEDEVDTPIMVEKE